MVFRSAPRRIPLTIPSVIQAPEIVAMYGLVVTPALIRRRIREQFERNRYIDDIRIIDRLLFKGQQQYQETMNVWMQEPHIMGILLQPQERRQKSFLEKFYEVSIVHIVFDSYGLLFLTGER